MSFILRTGTLFENFQTLGDWTIITGTGSVTSQGLELVSAVGSASTATKTISYDSTSMGVMKIRVYISSTAEIDNIASLQVYITTTTDWSKYYTKSFLVGLLHVGYNDLLIGMNEWTNTSGDSWGTMARFRVKVNAATGCTATVTYCHAYVGVYGRPKCVVMFDDARQSVYDIAYPYMSKYGIRGTTFVNSDLTDLYPGNYMSVDNLKVLYNAGWDIGNHSANHNRMNAQTDATNEDEVDTTAQWLSDHGFNRSNCHKHFAYPYGDYDEKTISILDDRNFLTQRSTVGGRCQYNGLDSRLLCWQTMTPDDTQADLEATVNRAISEGATLFLTFHIIKDADLTLSYEWETAKFQGLMDYVFSKRNQMDILTVSEWYGGLSGERRQIDFRGIDGI